jgi:hypothetical protein
VGDGLWADGLVLRTYLYQYHCHAAHGGHCSTVAATPAGYCNQQAISRPTSRPSLSPDARRRTREHSRVPVAATHPRATSSPIVP